MLDIEWERVTTAVEDAGNASQRHCDVCGGETDARRYEISLVFYAGNLYRTICEDCLRAGPEGIAARMREQAKDLRIEAAWLEEVAPLVARMSPEDLATPEEAMAELLGMDDG
jgi:hypothetical protein